MVEVGRGHRDHAGLPTADHGGLEAERHLVELRFLQVGSIPAIGTASRLSPSSKPRGGWLRPWPTPPGTHGYCLPGPTEIMIDGWPRPGASFALEGGRQGSALETQLGSQRPRPIPLSTDGWDKLEANLAAMGGWTRLRASRWAMEGWDKLGTPWLARDGWTGLEMTRLDERVWNRLVTDGSAKLGVTPTAMCGCARLEGIPRTRDEWVRLGTTQLDSDG